MERERESEMDLKGSKGFKASSGHGRRALFPGHLPSTSRPVSGFFEPRVQERREMYALILLNGELEIDGWNFQAKREALLPTWRMQSWNGNDYSYVCKESRAFFSREEGWGRQMKPGRVPLKGVFYCERFSALIDARYRASFKRSVVNCCRK